MAKEIAIITFPDIFINMHTCRITITINDADDNYKRILRAEQLLGVSSMSMYGFEYNNNYSVREIEYVYNQFPEVQRRVIITPFINYVCDGGVLDLYGAYGGKDLEDLE